MNLNRRESLRALLGAPLVAGLAGWLPSASAAGQRAIRQNPETRRLVIVFSPNGTIPSKFWPASGGPLGDLGELPEILQPLEEFRDRTLVLHGIDNRIRGDGDDHMRGMGCLLTGIELSPGNIQGGGNTPAGWPRGISIDQELANFFQSDPATRCRFGSLELGVLVPDRADVWTRMVYSAANRPVTPIADPRRLFQKLFGVVGDRESLRSVLEIVAADLKSVAASVSGEDQARLNDHLDWVRQKELELRSADSEIPGQLPPVDGAIELNGDNMPAISQAQQDLLVAALRTGMTRIATLQYTNSVGNAKMKFLGIEEGHHELSHEPDEKQDAAEKLVTINRWYCEQIAALARQLANTPEADGAGTLLDHTTIVWTNELGKGNSHSLSDIPFVLVGGGMGWKSGQALQFDHMPHNRLWISVAHAMGHRIEKFGSPRHSRGGVIEELFA